MKTKHSFNHWHWRIIISSMIGYAIFYFVRKNFSFAMPALGDAYGISNTSFGIILTLVGLIYGVSKFVNGIFADRTNARWHLAIALAICAGLNFMFGWSDSISTMITGSTQGAEFVDTMVIVMAVLLVLNNIFQGAGFPPCNHLLAHWVPSSELATKSAIWNTSHSIGAGFVSILCGYLISSTGDWHYCFTVPAWIAVFGVVFIIITLRDTPSSVGLPELEGTKTSLDENDSPEAFRAFIMKMVFKNPIIWILSFTALFVYIVRFAILDWGPTFLQKRENPLSPELTGWVLAIFEISGCLGMLCAGYISDKFFGGKSQRVCVVEMFLVAICLVVLQFMPDSAHPIFVLILLALAGFFLYGPQALLAVTGIKQATKKAASTSVGVIGFVSYLSVIFTGWGLGWFSDKFGWDYLFILMAGVAIFGGIVIATLWNIKDDAYEH